MPRRARATRPARPRSSFRRVLDENRSVERKVMQALAERVLSYAGDPTL